MNVEQFKQGNIRITYMDGLIVNMVGVTRVTHIGNSILINFSDGTRKTLVSTNVRNVHTDPNVYVAFGVNKKQLPEPTSTYVGKWDTSTGRIVEYNPLMGDCSESSNK